jgi:hypothetical protein
MAVFFIERNNLQYLFGDFSIKSPIFAAPKGNCPVKWMMVR